MFLSDQNGMFLSDQFLDGSCLCTRFRVIRRGVDGVTSIYHHCLVFWRGGFVVVSGIHVIIMQMYRTTVRTVICVFCLC
jgi:hypothetical protein